MFPYKYLKKRGEKRLSGRVYILPIDTLILSYHIISYSRTCYGNQYFLFYTTYTFFLQCPDIVG